MTTKLNVENVENVEKVEIPLDDEEEEVDVEELFEEQITKIKCLLYDESNKTVLKKIKPLFEELETNLIGTNEYSPDDYLYFFKDEMEEYCSPDYKIDKYKVKVIELLLHYITFDTYYIEIAADYTEKIGKLDDDYVERDEVAEEVLNTLLCYSFCLYRDNKLSQEDCNTIVYTLIRNKKFTHCVSCLEIFNLDLSNQKIFDEVWNYGDKECIKTIISKYFTLTLKDE